LRNGLITGGATGPGAAEAFGIVAVATVLITHAPRELTSYPQVGGLRGRRYSAVR
jgi:hypothetical protein